LIAATTLSHPAPVAAECTHFDPWPSFTAAASTAKRIVVGEVVESYANDSADNAVTFRVRVDEVLRGPLVTSLEFRDVVVSGAPLEVCDDSILRVLVGDVLAFAFDAHLPGVAEPVLAVAWIRGTPDEFLVPGAERLTLAQARALAGLPPTDTLPEPRSGSRANLPLVPLLGMLAGLTVLILRRRRGLVGRCS
jgi:hypothetical protein